MKPLKLTRAFFLMTLLVLSVALVSCVPEEDDDEEDSRIPVVRQLV